MLLLNGDKFRIPLIREVIEMSKIWAGLKGSRRVWDTRGSVHRGRPRRVMSTRSDGRRRCLRS
eukprot:8716595-Pyramimonas_sp.AAC.1